MESPEGKLGKRGAEHGSGKRSTQPQNVGDVLCPYLPFIFLRLYRSKLAKL